MRPVHSDVESSTSGEALAVLAHQPGRTSPGPFWRYGILYATLAFYAVMAPFGYLAFALLALVPTRDPIRRARRLQTIMSAAFDMLQRWMVRVRMLRSDRHAQRQGFPNEPCVLVANHPSIFDVAALISIKPGLATVIKPQLYQQWWLRPLMRSSMQIEGGDNPLSAGRVLDDAAVRLRDGFSVLIFPEGTRSPEGRLLPFQRAAFELACRARVSLVPVVMRYRSVWMSKETPLLRPPKHTTEMTISYLPAIDPASHGYDSRALHQAVSAQYRRLLTED